MPRISLPPAVQLTSHRLSPNVGKFFLPFLPSPHTDPHTLSAPSGIHSFALNGVSSQDHPAFWCGSMWHGFAALERR